MARDFQRAGVVVGAAGVDCDVTPLRFGAHLTLDINTHVAHFLEGDDDFATAGIGFGSGGGVGVGGGFAADDAEVFANGVGVTGAGLEVFNEGE